MDTSIYYDFILSLLYSNLPSKEIRKRLIKILSCKSNGNNYYCGFCEFCKQRKQISDMDRLLSNFFNPVSIDYFALTFSLPQIEIDGVGNLGDMFNFSSSDFRDENIRGNEILNGLRKNGVESIKDIFSEYQIGLFSGIHINDSFLNFNPHLHMILSGTAILDGWKKSEIDSRNIHSCKRNLFSRKSGMTPKRLEKMLLKEWARTLSEHCFTAFKLYRDNLTSKRVESSGARYLRGITLSELEEMRDKIYQAVLKDKKCIQVEKIQSADSKDLMGVVSDYDNFKRSTAYCFGSPLKHNKLLAVGNGVTIKTESGKYIGDFKTIAERYLKILGVKNVRRYQAFGLFSRACGKKEHQEFVKVINSLK